MGDKNPKQKRRQDAQKKSGKDADEKKRTDGLAVSKAPVKRP